MMQSKSVKIVLKNQADFKNTRERLKINAYKNVYVVYTRHYYFLISLFLFIYSSIFCGKRKVALILRFMLVLYSIFEVFVFIYF